MKELFDWIFEHGDRITVISLLFMSLVGFVVAMQREWFVTGRSYRSMLETKDAEIQRTREDCQKVRDMNDRLLLQLERGVTATEIVARKVARR